MRADLQGNVEWLTADGIAPCVVQNGNIILLQLPNQEVMIGSILSNE
jgi:hypothetical protein